MRRLVKYVVVAGVVGFLGLQAVPYGWWDANPPIRTDVEWPDPEAERLARAACYDCHSNETRRPAYTYIAPMSWLVRHDVEEGRDELNFSDWDGGDARDAIEAINVGAMPPSSYTFIHRDAALDDVEMATLVRALQILDNRR